MFTINQFNSKIRLSISILFLLIISINSANSQTPGMIYQAANPAGATVMDPNGDGYISQSSSGFENNDVAESEIPFVKIPVIYDGDPNGDLNTGPDCGFTDMVGDAGSPSVSFFVDNNNNLMFRFRLGGTATNSKGYSILIDTDGKFGNSGPDADPNYVVGNPGFEVEIILRTNFGVSLYDVDGTTNGELLITLPYEQYHQKAIAHSTFCGTDYFYDFYIPFATITSYFPDFTPNTPIRMLANTVTFPASTLNRKISDVAGIDDEAFGYNYELMWSTMIDDIAPASINDIQDGTNPVRTAKPVVSAPVSGTATTISGTSTEADGTDILVYRNDTLIGSTTVSTGTWSLGSITVQQADIITARAHAGGKTISNLSDEVIVAVVCTEAPLITGLSGANNRGYEGTSVPNAIIRIYANGVQQNAINNGGLDHVVADGSGAWTFLWCTTGNHCRPCGSTVATAQLAGECESVQSNVWCSNYSQNGCAGYATTTAPSITTPDTVFTSSTSVGGDNNDIDPVDIFLYTDGNLIATELNVTGSAAWTISGLTFEPGQLITARAIATTDGCLSDTSNSKPITEYTTAPVVNEPLIVGSTSVSGTSTEAEGTAIEVFVNSSSVGSTTVDANANWLITGLTTPLSVSNAVTARATASLKVISSLSNEVIVDGASAIPVVSGIYNENSTSVSGTGIAGSQLILYVDGTIIDTVIVDGSNNWSVTDIDSREFYPGAAVYATQIEAGMAESEPSDEVIVSCVTPLDNLTVSLASDNICKNDPAVVTVHNSEHGVIYQLINNNDDTNLSSTALGTGNDLIINSFPLNDTVTIKVKALKISAVSCESILQNTVKVARINELPNDGLTVSGEYTFVCTETSVNIIVESSELSVNYQLMNDDGDTEIGSVVSGTGGNINLPTGSLNQTITVYVIATNDTSGCNSGLVTVGQKISITVKDAEAGEDIYICDNLIDEATLNANDPAPGSGIWTVVSGSGDFINSGDPNTVVENLGAGTNVFRWTISYDPSVCGGSTFSDVEVHKGICSPSEYNVSSARNIDSYSNGDTIAIAVNNSGSISGATDFTSSLPAGLSLNSTTGLITVSDTSLLVSGTYTFDISLESDNDLGSLTDTVSVEVTINPDNEAVWEQMPLKNLNDYVVGDTIYKVSDADGDIVEATLLSGTMPSWAYLNPVNGTIRVVNLPVDNNNYSFTVRTIDETGGITEEILSPQPLPVELISFTAKLVNDAVFLEWITASEFNNDYFELQRNVEGENWSTFSIVNGKGTTYRMTHYDIVDRKALNHPGELIYYRFIQHDFNGDSHISNVVSINIPDKNISEFELYPNPANDNISIKLYNHQEFATTIHIYNLQGKLMMSREIELNAGYNNLYLTIDQLPSGLYILNIPHYGYMFNTSFLKN